MASYQGPLVNWLKTANLLYFLFLPFKLAGLSPDLIVKIFGPFFYGALLTTFYFFVRRFLGFDRLKSFLGSMLLLFQIATLRVSWDLYRNELGLIFLFLALINLPKISKTKNLIYFSLASILVVLSHELVTVILLIVLIVFLLKLFLDKKFSSFFRLVVPFVLVAGLFVMVLESSGQVLYDPHVMFASQALYFWRYFYEYNKIMSYSALAGLILTLFWLLFGLLLPLAIYGFWQLRRNLVLTTITLWLLVGTFSSLIFAGKGLIVWERWLIMLVFPLVIYALEGIWVLGSALAKPKDWARKFPLLAHTLATMFLLVIFGFFVFRAIPFLSTSYPEAKPPLANDKLNAYLPRTMVHNSVGIWKIEYTLDVVEWLDKHAPPGSVVLVDNRFRGLMLTRFEIDNRYIITNPWSESIQNTSLTMAKKKKFKPVYLIWNTTKAIDEFDRIYSSGNMGVYQALPEFYQ